MMSAAPPNAPSGSPDDPSSHWTGPTKGGVEYTNDASPVPLRIGRYTVIKLIGAGGMGAVYEAEQAQPKRRVALKLIRQAFAGESARVRFQQEAQHLAELDHPAIAKVYEAGAHTQDIGGPIAFIAMEFVQGGEAITRFARKRNLPLRARLELVAQVCDALHHAHERGVIHRDIKPANVLVADDGRPKIIDFGVARADMLAGERRPGVTLEGQMIGTLEYMAPEQCLADPNDPNAIDRRTDVYAIGLLLYELVVGFMPYDVSRADIPTAINVIRETPPEPPRKSNPDLPREVETIMLKALRKERGERYATAKDMGDDLRRFLADEAILARRESATESVARAARRSVVRHPKSTIALYTIVAAVLAVLTAWPLSVTLFQPLNAWYSGLFVRVVPSNAAVSLDSFVIIGRTETTGDGTQLAQRLGIQHFDAEQKPAWRLLHAELMKRLAKGTPSLVAFDMFFRAPTEYDQAFVEGANALASAGIPVLVGARGIAGPDGAPFVSPTILPHVRWGDVAAQPAPHGASLLTALYVPEGTPPKPSWGVQVFAHLREPDATPQYVLKSPTELEVRWLRPHRAFSNVEAYARPPELISVLEQHPAAGALDREAPGARHYGVMLDPLSKARAESVVIPYERAISMPEGELRARVQGKVVLIAHLADPDDTFTINGEDQPGVFLQLAALGALASHATLRYLDAGLILALVLFASLLGAALALALRRMPIIPQTIVAMVVLTIALVGGSLIAYSSARVVFEPFTPFAAAIFAALLVRWLLSLRRQRPGSLA